MSAQEIKPCPECGCEAQALSDEGSAPFWVSCRRRIQSEHDEYPGMWWACAKGPDTGGRESAIAAWNRVSAAVAQDKSRKS